MKRRRMDFWWMTVGILCFLVSAIRVWAEPAGIDLKSSLGEENLKGVKTQILQMKFSEVVTSDRNFKRSDLEKNKQKYLKVKAPILIDPAGKPYPLQFIGREVKQIATQNKLHSEFTFKYKHPSLTDWKLDDPILVAFDGQIFHTRPEVRNRDSHS